VYFFLAPAKGASQFIKAKDESHCSPKLDPLKTRKRGRIYSGKGDQEKGTDLLAEKGTDLFSYEGVHKK
jgi:hypothetical protein